MNRIEDLTNQNTNIKTKINNSQHLNNNVTRILFDDNSSNLAKNDLTKEINDAENITIEITKFEQSKKGKYRNIPKFFKFEYRNAKICLIFMSILFIAAISSITYIAIDSYLGNLNYWLLLPVSLCSLIIIGLFAKSISDFHFIRKDLINCDFLIDSIMPMTSIRKIYKKLLSANIMLNWLSATGYVVCGFGVLLAYIVSYFINLSSLDWNDFTRLIIGENNYLPVIFVWTFVGVAGFIFLIQFIFNIINKKRVNGIELFYKEPIYNELEIAKIKKSANIKGAIIFTFSLLIVGIAVLVVYLILKKKVGLK